MHLQLDGRGAVYEQVYRALKALIDQGSLVRGDRIPGSRSLMRDLAVSRNSVLTALHMLQVEGYLESRQGAGTFVCAADVEALPAPPLAPGEAGAPPGLARRLEVAMRFGLARWMGQDRPVRYDFRYGRTAFPPASARAWSQVQSRRLRRGAWPQRPSSLQGEPALRRAIAAHLALNRGIRCEPGQILVTNGSQESIHLCLSALLGPGDRLVLEEPGYLPVRVVAELCGAEIVKVPVDHEGLDPAALPEQARMVFVTPSHQFPTGAVLPAARRQALYAWARRSGGWIYEDDYDSEFRYDIRPLPALKRLDVDDRVIHAGSFSKTMYSGIRLGFVVLPAPLVAPLVELKTCASGAAPTFMQRAMTDFLESGDYQRHLNRVRKVYAERRERLLDGLQRHLAGRASWSGSQGGVHVYLRTRSTLTPEAFVARGEQADVGATPLPGAPGAGLPLALGYGGIEADQIDPGIAALAEVIG